jgi:hypothetical protein
LKSSPRPPPRKEKERPCARGRPSFCADYRLSLWQIITPVWQAAIDIPEWIWWDHLQRIFMSVDDLGCRDLLGK